MAENMSMKGTWSHDPLGASEAGSLAYLLLDITQPNAPSQSEIQNPKSTLNLSLVLDSSGSMAGEKLDNLKKAVAWLINHLSERDTVSITLFDDEVRPLVGSTKVTDRVALVAQV